ncbi:hypothetical protein SAMN05428952_101445 [Nitrosomonas sp. Nm132]|nr:hypothetical protein SAMN05428952_101445 [Nitrosomonas sp. Nm132]
MRERGVTVDFAQKNGNSVINYVENIKQYIHTLD